MIYLLLFSDSYNLLDLERCVDRRINQGGLIVKRADVIQTYQQRSTTASTICRQLAFAGIAIVWLFRSNPKASALTAQLEPEFVLAALFIVFGLAFDLTQYIYGSLAWGILNRVLEKRNISRELEFTVHPAINWPALACFWLKLICVAFAYATILVDLSERFITK